MLAASLTQCDDKQVLLEALPVLQGAYFDDSGFCFGQWSADSDVCSFGGVTCAGGNVTELSLFGCALRGTLPSGLSRLARLTTLSLLFGELSGPLPAAWRSWSSLRALDLTQNVLSGTLPPDWGNWSTVTALALSSNRLSGALPRSWTGMSSLRQLSLGSNRLTGALPDEWAAWPSLTQLHLADNKLSGALPVAWRDWTALQDLTLNGNELSGPLPAAWASWASLRTLDLSRNKFSSSLPDEWTKFALVKVDLSRNELTGPLPRTYAQWATLQEFVAAFNQLEGSLPAEWFQWASLRKLDVQANRLSGELPHAWSNWSGLIDCLLGTNSFTGTLPPIWVAWPKLRELRLFDNRLDGTLPPAWASWRSMTLLYVNGNRLSGALPPSWGNWSGLQRFGGADNQFSGALPIEWAALRSLSNLALGNNKFNGSLPPQWVTMTGLRYLELANNALTGLLPTAWGNMTGINFMYLSGNALSGSLPDSWGGMRSLRTLDLTSNGLSGALPVRWGDLKALTLLRLSLNQFTGALPPQWGSMTALDELHASRNALTGTLPPDWGKLLRLSVLDLSFNQLSGALPSAWNTMRNLKTLVLSSNQLSSEMPIPWGRYGNLPLLRRVYLSGNRFVGDVPHQWGFMISLQLLDLSGNCLQPTHANITTFLIRSLSSLMLLDLTPECLASATPVNTTLPLTAPWTHRVVNRWELCPTFYCLSEAHFLAEWTQCFAALYRPVVECFSDANASVGCDRAAAVTPTWHNRTRLVPFLPSGALNFTDAANAQYAYGVFYRVRFEFGVGLTNGSTLSLTVHTPTFQGPWCPLNTTIAIVGTTSCAPCPEHSRCDGTHVAQAGAAPAWRLQTSLLPFYPCDRELTEGCPSTAVGGTRDQQAANASLVTGEACAPQYRGALCMNCNAGFTKVGAFCVPCLSRDAQAAVFVGALVVLLVAVFVVIKASLSSVAREVDAVFADAEAWPACIQEPLDRLAAFFSAHQERIDNIVVVVRQLLNHFSFVGALNHVRTAQTMSDGVRTALAIQHGANSFVLGQYTNGLACLFPGASSKSTLTFNALWAVFGGVFVFETLIYLALTRHWPSVAAVALFLGFLADAPLTEAAARLLSVCSEYKFWDQTRYLQFPPNFDEGPESEALYKPSAVVRLLASDLTQDCDEPGFRSYYVTGAVLTIAVVSIGLPLAAAVGYRYLTPKNDDADDEASKKMVTSRNEIFSFLTDHYRDEAWYFELIIFARKLAVALVLGALSSYPTLQLQIFDVIALIMLILSIALQPAAEPRANLVDQLSVASAVVAASLMSVASEDELRSDVAVAVTSAALFLVTQVLAVLGIVAVYGGWFKSVNKYAQKVAARVQSGTFTPSTSISDAAVEDADDTPASLQQRLDAAALRVVSLRRERDELSSAMVVRLDV